MLSRSLTLSPLLAVLILVACALPNGKASPAPQGTVAAKITTPAASSPLPTSTPLPQPAIIVTAPIAGQSVRSPVQISGTAQVFEGNVQMAVKDATGKVVGKGFTTASAGAPQRGTFSTDITFTQPITAQSGTVEVFSQSPKDGSVKDLVAIKVTLAGR